MRKYSAFKPLVSNINPRPLHLGPLFVKLGQNLANRPDLVDEELMEELTKLQDRVPAFPNDQAMKIIEVRRCRLTSG